MNNIQYFTNCENVAEIKSRYHQLAKDSHPDRNPNDATATATMQEINAQYKTALENCDGATETGTDNRPHTYHYNETNEQAIIDKIAEILAADMPEGVTVWLIGTWIWVRGTDKADTATRAKLKTLRMRWSAKRGSYHWTPAKRRGGRYNKNADLDGLAQKYGASTFSKKARPALA